jgi:membrane-associated phospholipid phosphatase
MRGRWPATMVQVVFALAIWAASIVPASANDLQKYGDIAQFAIPGFAAAGALLDSDYEGLAQFAASFGTTIAVTLALQNTVREDRPGGRPDMAFPSGHTSLAFSGAAFIHYRYGWEWGIPAELAAAAVAYSRVDAREHHWHDVIASAVIAHASAFAFVDPKNESVFLLPFVELRKPAFGIVAMIRF